MSMGIKRLRAALADFKGSSAELLHIVAKHIEFEEPDAWIIIESVANLLENEGNERA
jgi:hypothetical protein